MKGTRKLILAILAGVALTSALSGCVVVPVPVGGGGYYHHYYR